MNNSGTTTLRRITLDTNPDHCNLNCIMCEDHSPYSESRPERKRKGTLRPIMRKELLQRVLREAVTLGVTEIIPSTMGEPLLYPHFDEILALCHEYKLSLNLTTNGTFPGPGETGNAEYWAERICPVGSDVKISWNGATAATHEAVMLGAKLEHHLSNAKRFIAVRDKVYAQQGHYCSITMQLTFLESNLDEIPAMVRQAIGLGLDRVKGHHLWSHFDQIKGESLRRDVLDIERWNHTVRECQDIAGQHNARGGKTLKLDNFFELDPARRDEIAKDGECPFLNKEAWVDPAGRFNVCCAPDKQRETLGDFGNLRESSLAEIISSEAYQDLCRNYMNNQLCQGCNMRKPPGS